MSLNKHNQTIFNHFLNQRLQRQYKNTFVMLMGFANEICCRIPFAARLPLACINQLLVKLMIIPRVVEKSQPDFLRPILPVSGVLRK